MEVFLIHTGRTLHNIMSRKLGTLQTKLQKSISLTKKKKLKKLLKINSQKRKQLLSTNQWEVYFTMRTTTNYSKMLRTNWVRDWDPMLEQKNGSWRSQKDNLPSSTIKNCDNLTSTKNRESHNLELKVHPQSNKNQIYNRKWSNFLSLFLSLNSLQNHSSQARIKLTYNTKGV